MGLYMNYFGGFGAQNDDQLGGGHSHFCSFETPTPYGNLLLRASLDWAVLLRVFGLRLELGGGD